jgi:hypothetical protein
MDRIGLRYMFLGHLARVGTLCMYAIPRFIGRDSTSESMIVIHQKYFESWEDVRVIVLRVVSVT